MQPSQARRDVRNRESPKRRLNATWTTRIFCQAIHRACRKVGVPLWSPGRLRHNAATHIEQEFGIDFVAAVLGHSKLATSEFYISRTIDKAIEVMGRIG